MLEVKNLHKQFHGTPILKGIDLQVNKGEELPFWGRPVRVKPLFCAV